MDERSKQVPLGHLIETCQEGVVLIDGQGKILLINRAALRMFGYRSEEVLGQPLDVLLPPAHGGQPSFLSRQEANSGTGDPDKLKQVLLNLGKNATEAMPKGGQLTIGAEIDEANICFFVADTGPGLPEDTDIFAPFMGTKQGGMGLGLPVVHQLVQSHQGRLQWSSPNQRGTRFTITLPRHTQPGAAS